MKQPTPIDNSTLPTGRPNAIPCWRFNLHRAAFDLHGGNPVSKVWATQRVVYFTDPSVDGFASGSQFVGTLYETEADALAACVIAVEEEYAERLGNLKAEANKAGATKVGGFR